MPTDCEGYVQFLRGRPQVSEGNREGVTDVQYDKMVDLGKGGKIRLAKSRGMLYGGACLMFMIPQAHRSLLF